MKWRFRGVKLHRKALYPVACHERDATRKCKNRTKNPRLSNLLTLNIRSGGRS